jgi:acyl transferase domain-containing protein/NAD(P)H-dependent flavin oxidoreductase YrpB (nitropropane dioxygenase family)/NAD(P)-dependent dehydrogenase (short-subunit alcohol dehydrogenase family)
MDRGYCIDEDLPLARTNLELLLKEIDNKKTVGLRLEINQLKSSRELLLRLCGRSHILVFAGWDKTSLERLPGELPASGQREIFLEVTQYEELKSLDGSGVKPSALIARGHECGGWVGEDSSFILAQKMLGSFKIPVYVQGGIGIFTAAACRAAGAAGIVLDDQLLLMAESPLPADWRSLLEKTDGHETKVLGQCIGASCRIVFRRGMEASRSLESKEQALESELDSGTGSAAARGKWRRWVTKKLGWGDPSVNAWPVGESIGLAASFAEEFRTTGRLIRALLDRSLEQVVSARELSPFAPGSLLARSHGTRYPIVQGPMSRVSDNAEFVLAAAEAGALPFVALSTMDERQVRPLLDKTRRLLGNRPWGVGILGFAPEATGSQQLQCIVDAHPTYALIAGGQPEQAARFESQGIKTYLHVPVPGLLKIFLERGSRRFVFEGRECGGHIGPLHSFTLWESMIKALLETVRPEVCKDIYILFAGGIHDARSAAMVGAAAAPLAARGIHVGLLVGTAYLFTEEAVASHAIVKAFQDEALDCRHTTYLEISPGHAVRCIPTPFVDEFHRRERECLAAGEGPSAIKESMEKLIRGRLRIATKGLDRDIERKPVALKPEEQLTRGWYMIGQAATMHSTLVTMESLHREISEGSTDLLKRLPLPRAEAGKSKKPPSAIAVIGMSTLLPGAQHHGEFWQNLIDKVNCIREIPADRWDWRLYYHPDVETRDKINSKWGGFLDDVALDPLSFGIPPNSLKYISPGQLLILEAVRRALADAGIKDHRFDRENTSVILGSDGGCLLRGEYALRSMLPCYLEGVSEDLLERLPEWNHESFPGFLTNILAGRVANRFDLGGSNFTVNSACASSLTAVDLAAKELESGASNMVIAGGVDIAQDPFAFMSFSKTHTLSPGGRARPFDKSADGIVISEGISVVILKRLDDARRDGDRIYSVIRSISSASDGKGVGLMAPKLQGQRRTFDRAYRNAGIRPSTLGLYEAHGTGTVVGDSVELDSFTQTLKADNASPRSCALGSVKGLIGHTKTAAGAVGLIKASLALYYKTLPPHADVENPLDAVEDSDSPIYILKEAHSWLQPQGHPRRSAVSAFGFGGTNVHVVLEEYTGNFNHRVLGADRWPYELFVFRARDKEELAAQFTALVNAVESGAAPTSRDLAYSLARKAQKWKDKPVCASVVAKDPDDLKNILVMFLNNINGASFNEMEFPPHINITLDAKKPDPLVAFLFPGQGSQYIDMARETALYFKEMREVLEYADTHFRDFYPKRLSQYIYPHAAFSSTAEAAANEELTGTHMAQSAIGAVSLGFYHLLTRLGITPDMVAGHSYGEFSALHAAGVLSRPDFLTLSEIRGRLMRQGEGTMAAVKGAREAIEAHINQFDGIVMANHNTLDQFVISGPTASIEKAAALYKSLGMKVKRLPVGGAFHSPLMESAQAPLVETLERITLHRPVIPVYSNVTAKPYPHEPTLVRRQLNRHLLSPVEFYKQVTAMAENGARVFLEVGPNNVLSVLVRNILEEKKYTAVSVDGQGGGLRGFLCSLGRLLTAGVDFNIEALFQDCEVKTLDLDHLAELTKKTADTEATWLVNSASSRPYHQAAAYSRKHPLLTAETVVTGQMNTGVLKKSPPWDEKSVAFPRTAGGNDRLLTVYKAYQETMRQFLRTQEQVMQQYLAGKEAFPGPMPAVPFAPGADTVSQSIPVKTTVGEKGVDVPSAGEALARTESSGMEGPPGPIPTREFITENILTVVSRHTGYPKKMLGLDMDMESELGIDSIKITEILDNILKVLPDVLALSLKEQLTNPKRFKTLNELIVGIESVKQRVDKTGAAGYEEGKTVLKTELKGVSLNVSNKVQPPVDEQVCPRYKMTARESRLFMEEPGRLQGLFLITEDELGTAAVVSNELQTLGVKAVIVRKKILRSPSDLEAFVTRTCKSGGSVAGLIHLAPLSRGEMPQSLVEWRRLTQAHSKSLFQLLRFCTGNGSTGKPAAVGRVLSASLMGGYFGREGSPGMGLPAGGSNCGLLKSLALEWPDARVKAVDFDKNLLSDRIARIIIDELLYPDDLIEIGYPGGRRVIFQTTAAPLEKSGSQVRLCPGSDWVVLVTGGARGITAEIADTLVAAGMKIFVVGRSRLEMEENPLTQELQRSEDLRNHFLEVNAASGIVSTPFEIEKKVRTVLKEREGRRNLRRLEERGAEVFYRSLDVRDDVKFGALLESIYKKYGRLDAVIHGAGVITDKLLHDKTIDEFDAVFDTKVDSTFILSRYLQPASLKLFVLFGSVAGRFGNRGQTDYAAANELLNRFSHWLNIRWDSTRVVTINWGPWQGPGMASASVTDQLRRQGMVPISPSAGRHFFTDEIEYGKKGDIEIIAGKGPWSIERELPALPLTSEIDLGELFLQIDCLIRGVFYK